MFSKWQPFKFGLDSVGESAVAFEVLLAMHNPSIVNVLVAIVPLCGFEALS
jgi:hypothetical protein